MRRLDVEAKLLSVVEVENIIISLIEEYGDPQDETWAPIYIALQKLRHQAIENQGKENE